VSARSDAPSVWKTIFFDSEKPLLWWPPLWMLLGASVGVAVAALFGMVGNLWAPLAAAGIGLTLASIGPRYAAVRTVTVFGVLSSLLCGLAIAASGNAVALGVASAAVFFLTGAPRHRASQAMMGMLELVFFLYALIAPATTAEPSTAILLALAGTVGAVAAWWVVDLIRRVLSRGERSPEAPPRPPAPLREVYAGAFSAENPQLMWAAVRAIVLGIGMFSTVALDPSGLAYRHALWITVTVFSVFKPLHGYVVSRGLARAAGTAAGIAVFSVLYAVLPVEVAVGLSAVFLLVGMSFTLQSYFLQTLGLTASVVAMLGTLHGGDYGLYALLRFEDTLLGTVLALGLSYVMLAVERGRSSRSA